MKKYNHLWLNQLLFQNPKHSRYIPICILIRGKSIFSLGTHQQPSKGAKSFDLWFPASKWQWTILFGQLKCFDSRVANRIWQIYWLNFMVLLLLLSFSQQKKLGNWMKGGRVETISWTKKNLSLIHKKAENERWRRQAIWPKVDLFWHICYFVPGSLRCDDGPTTLNFEHFFVLFFCMKLFSAQKVWKLYWRTP